jgi:hypothetical protein
MTPRGRTCVLRATNLTVAERFQRCIVDEAVTGKSYSPSQFHRSRDVFGRRACNGSRRLTPGDNYRKTLLVNLLLTIRANALGRGADSSKQLRRKCVAIGY